MNGQVAVADLSPSACRREVCLGEKTSNSSSGLPLTVKPARPREGGTTGRRPPAASPGSDGKFTGKQVEGAHTP